MEKNTLVKHRHLDSLGIGIVNRSLKRSIEVKFGQNDIGKFSPSELAPVDMSHIQTIPRSDFESGYVQDPYLIVGNVLKHFLGIEGYIFIRTATEEDLARFRVVI